MYPLSEFHPVKQYVLHLGALILLTGTRTLNRVMIRNFSRTHFLTSARQCGPWIKPVKGVHSQIYCCA